MSKYTDTIENEAIYGNITLLPNSNPSDEGDGSLKIYGTTYTDTISANTVGGSVSLQSIKMLNSTIALNNISAPTNPYTNNQMFFSDSIDSKFKSINNSGIVTVYQPTTILGDISTHNGTTQIRLPIGTAGQILTAGSSGVSWTNPPGTGTVTSVSATVPSFLSITGSPITTSGTLAISLSGTALPILNGGTGSTTAIGTGSVVLANSPSLITPNIGVATGTSLSVTGNITINGAGTGGSPNLSTIYINPSSTILSGNNSYFYTFFATPTTTGSTTGTGSTVYIQNSPPNTSDSYALFVNSGATFLGGRLYLSTTSDIPAINPDAFNTLIVYEDQTQSTVYSGILTGSSTFLQNNYIQLTPATSNTYGQIYWRRNPGNSFSASFEIYNGSAGGGDELSFFWYCTAIPSTTTNYNTGLTGGYNLIFQDYSSGTAPGTSLWYNGVQLGSTVSNISNITNSQFNTVSLIFIRDTIRVFFNGILIINYQDTTNRLPNNFNAYIGFTGYCSTSNNFHRVRNIRIAKTNEGILQYASPTSSNMYINATNIGIGNVNPTYTLDVTGTARFTNNINTPLINLTGSTSGIITIQPQAIAGTYNLNLPTTSGTAGQVLTSQGTSAMTWTNPPGTGTVTSVTATVPSFLSISGSPITTSGTLAISLSGTALPILNGGTGSTIATGTGSVVLSNTPTLITPVIGSATGTSLSVTGNINSLTHTITGATSGVITIQSQAIAGTYNFNLPITSGTAGQVLTSQGGGTSAMTWSTNLSARTIWVCSRQFSVGTNGGGITANTLTSELLNTITSSQTDTSVTLNTNTGEMTITPGTYYIEAFVIGYQVGSFWSILQNNTTSTTVIIGTSINTSKNGSLSYSIIKGFIKPTSTNLYQIFSECSTTNNNTGKGIAAGFGTEVYTNITITSLA